MENNNDDLEREGAIPEEGEDGENQDMEGETKSPDQENENPPDAESPLESRKSG